MRLPSPSAQHEGPTLAPASLGCTLPPVNTTGDNHESLLPDLRRMADEIRVRIHLGGLDAKDAWTTLEAKLHNLEHKAQAATGRAKEQLGELGTMLKRELQELVGRLPKDENTKPDAPSS